MPLMDAGVLTLVDDGAEIVPGVRYRRSGGHTAHHQVVTIAVAADGRRSSPPTCIRRRCTSPTRG